MVGKIPSHSIKRSTAQGGQFSVITTPSNWSILGYHNHTGQEWDKGTDAWFVIKELKEHTPIVAEVRRTIPWGRCMQIPGVG
jgi:hypothetical protein